MFGKKKPLDGLFAQLQDVKDEKGNHLNTVLFSDKCDCSVVIQVENPVQQYCTDADQYFAYTDVLNNIVQTLGEGYALQKQDIFCKQYYHHEITESMPFLSQSYFRYYEGRPYTEITTYLIITQEAVKSAFVKYDPKMWLDFHVKVSKVLDVLTERGVRHHKLNCKEVDEYLHRFMAFNFKKGPFSMKNFKSTDEYLNLGDRVVKSVNLVDVDVINLPTFVRPYLSTSVNGYNIATDLLAFLTSVPDVDCIVYNQVVQIPQQRKLLRKQGIEVSVVNCSTVKPLDEQYLSSVPKDAKLFTMEEHMISGGFGENVTRVCLERGWPAPVHCFGVDDIYIQHGCHERLMEEAGLDAAGMADKVYQVLKGAGEVG